MNQIHTKKINSKHIVITLDNAGQRIDNFLIRYLGKIPKSRVYQMLRKGEVRINSGRIKQTYKLVEGDILRVPPVYLDKQRQIIPSHLLQQRILDSIIFEDEGLIIINKPAGFVVHSGSGQSYGIIETFRAIDDCYKNLELVHRLDKDTSGCLMLAKSIPILRQLHSAMNNDEIEKSYSALLAGRIADKKITIDTPLRKANNKMSERMVIIAENGKPAMTKLSRERIFQSATLVNIKLITGRTHQIRVHAASIDHPVIGDIKYGNRMINREYKKQGLKRMFLHAKTLKLRSPISKKHLIIDAPLEPVLCEFLEQLAN